MSFYTNPLTDYSPQMEAGGPVEADRWETDPASSRQGAETVFSEDEELEIASEFLDVGGERDLDRVIGELFDRAGEAGGATLEEPVERDLGDIFKSIAKVVLPRGGRRARHVLRRPRRRRGRQQYGVHGRARARARA